MVGMGRVEPFADRDPTDRYWHVPEERAGTERGPLVGVELTC
jgi:hypothetical protein